MDSTIEREDGSWEQTGGVKADARARAHQVLDKAQSKARELKDEVTERGREVRNEADRKAGRWASTAGKRTSSLTRALRVASDSLRAEGEPGMADLTGRAADQVERMSGYLEDENPSAMVHDLEDMGRRNPGAFLGSTFAMGLLVGRFLRSSTPSDGDRSAPSGAGGGLTDGEPGASRPSSPSAPSSAGEPWSGGRVDPTMEHAGRPAAATERDPSHGTAGTSPRSAPTAAERRTTRPAEPHGRGGSPAGSTPPASQTGSRTRPLTGGRPGRVTSERTGERSGGPTGERTERTGGLPGERAGARKDEPKEDESDER